MKKAETSNTKTAVRDGRFELLRIVAMLLIMLQHPLERSMEDGLPDMLREYCWGSRPSGPTWRLSWTR